MFCDCCCRSRSMKCRLVSLGVGGFCLLLVGGLLLFFYWLVFIAVVKQQTEIREGTLFWQEWLEPSQEVFINYYYLNVTNKEEFLAQETGHFVKPALQEVGPYTYRVLLKKDQIYTVDVTPEEIHYRQRSLLYFEPELSEGSEDDLITTINFPAVALGPMFEYIFSLPLSENISSIQKKLVYATINRIIAETNSSLLLTKSAGELLFGFQDPLLTAVADLLNVALNGTDYSHLLPIGDTFGMFMLKNSSFGWRDFHAYTGNPEYELTNKISRVANQTQLDFWYGEHCNMINGTDGTTRPPLLGKDKRIYFYYYNMCRSTYAEYSREGSVKKVPTWEYTVPRENFEPPKSSEYNRCFCPEDSEEEHCTHGGLLLRNCMVGGPVLVTAPHFLYGDGFYRNRLVGMVPDETKHASVYSYEPYTGACIQANKKLMFSIYMKPFENFPITQQITDVFAFPIFWMNGNYTITDEYANLLYGLIVISEGVFIGLQVVMCLFGLFLVTVAFYHAFRVRESKKKYTFHENPDTDKTCEVHEFTNKVYGESYRVRPEE